jgi:hypothetical protein
MEAKEGGIARGKELLSSQMHISTLCRRLSATPHFPHRRTSTSLASLPPRALALPGHWQLRSTPSTQQTNGINISLATQSHTHQSDLFFHFTTLQLHAQSSS